MTLRFGDIVIANDLLDPRGKNPKDRPAVIVTRTEEIEEGLPIFVVAITTTLPDPLPNDHVKLPWSRPRHLRTGLNERNAAVCRWLTQVDGKQIARVMVRVPTAQLGEVTSILTGMADDAG